MVAGCDGERKGRRRLQVIVSVKYFAVAESKENELIHQPQPPHHFDKFEMLTP